LTRYRSEPASPAVSHRDILKELEEAKDFTPDELKKLQHLKVRIKVLHEPGDLKRSANF
jgi:hypothetical protein